MHTSENPPGRHKHTDITDTRAWSCQHSDMALYASLYSPYYFYVDIGGGLYFRIQFFSFTETSLHGVEEKHGCKFGRWACGCHRKGKRI